MHIRKTLLLMTGAVGLALAATAAGAQDYGTYYEPGYNGRAPEEVIVRPPWHAPSRSAIGAPIEDVSLSRPVRIDDLDLRSDWGVRRLQSRISFAATTLCNQLNQMYPVTYQGTGGEWPRDSNCYRSAYERAMSQADDAIARARGGDYGGY